MIFPGRAIFNPLDLGNCVLWLDAADPTTFTTNATGSVIQWNDKGTSGKHVGQNDNTLRPFLTSSAPEWNGLGVVDCQTGARHWLSSSVSTNFNMPNTIFVVGKCRNTGSYVDGVTSTRETIQQSSKTAITLYAAGALVPTVSVSTSQPSLMVAVYRQVESDWYAAAFRNNGVWIAKDLGVGSSGLAAVMLGRDTSGGSSYLDGNIAEVIIYNRILPDSEITLVERYLGRKWGI